MILEIMIAGTTVAFISSLIFADRQIKRQREWDKEDDAPPPKPEPEPIIYPFVNIRQGTRCSKCLVESKNQVAKKNFNGYLIIESEAQGPRQPIACNDIKCKARDLPHLHATCTTCQYRWFMSPADQ